ncbi:MAG: hypothetical protein D6796_14790 [Caldilineae bacterium]|nr:MAG: hypothetical protein D6796_14790 [Caldilineae bacterium]
MPNLGYDELHYHVFLLRFWQERKTTPASPAVWRFCLEDVRSRRRTGFCNLQEMIEFLQQQMAGPGPRSEGDEGLW